MKLQLKYKDKVQHQIRAAFIRGASSEMWLAEINRWGIPAEKLKCYVVPESIQSVRSVGLFVIFGDVGELLEEKIKNPYGVVGNKLYVPVLATLTPEVTDTELVNVLLHNCQVFHPTIGLVGFNQADELSLAHLFELPPSNDTEWDFAKKGNSPLPKLSSIRVDQPPASQILDALRDAQEQRPLEDIPGGGDGSQEGGGSLMDDLKKGFFKGGLSAANGLRDVFSNMGSGGSSGGGSGIGGSDLFGKLGSWMSQQLKDLENKRKKELDRLMDMFDSNMDEALKYAIPLNDNYMNRGTAPPSDSLGRRSTNFDLGGLGGGGRVDGWNVDNHYFELRKKYLAAAKKAEEDGDFKKAAYIYAHLLGDLRQAAQVLEKGKFFREAAALYKDHLKDKQTAAECLELGGLLLEAIELFDELKKYEKVGDLYLQLEQRENAETYFEICIENAMKQGSYLDASRLWEDKMQRKDKALEVLLEGWVANSGIANACLNRYFKLVAEEEKMDLGEALENVYRNKTSYVKRVAFLDSLSHLNKLPEGEEVRPIARDIVYEILSEEVVEKKRVAHLHQLKEFLPSDRLIVSDTSRFVSNLRKQKKSKATTFEASLFAEFQLDRSIEWIQSVSHRNQFLILGKKNNRLHLARGNWYGNFEYYSWAEEIQPDDVFGLYALSFHSNHIVLYSSSKVGLKDLQLNRSKYFDETLNIQCPKFLPENTIAIGVLEKGRTAALHITNGHLVLSNYEYGGRLGVRCDLDFRVSGDWLGQQAPQELMYRAGAYYTILGNLSLKIFDSGSFEYNDLNSPLQQFTYTNHFSDLQFAYVTKDELITVDKSDSMTIKTALDLEADPIGIKFSPNLSTNSGLVVAGGKKAIVYDVNDSVTKANNTIDTKSSILDILPTVRRNRCGFLLESGQIVVYDLRKES